VLWPDTAVSDAALTRCIREIREALTDDARSPQYIETAHRRGFRFVGPPADVRQPIPRTKTKYAKSGGVNIAYQVVGDGPVDLVMVPRGQVIYQFRKHPQSPRQAKSVDPR